MILLGMIVLLLGAPPVRCIGTPRKILNLEGGSPVLQIILTLIIYLLLLIPVGNYVYQVAAGRHTFADPLMDRVDGGIYRLCGISPERTMDWKRYAIALDPEPTW